jgi:hypothetical protein
MAYALFYSNFGIHFLIWPTFRFRFMPPKKGVSEVSNWLDPRVKSNGIPAAPVHLFDPPTKIENEPGEESRHTKSTTNHSPTHSNAGIELTFDFLIHLVL